MGITFQNISAIYINDVLIPVVASDDSVQIDTPTEIKSITDNTGCSVNSVMPKNTTIKLKVLRGGDQSGGGFFARSSIPLPLQEQISSGQTVSVRFEFNDGNRRVIDTCKCTKGPIKGVGATDFELTLHLDHPNRWAHFA